jgi:hypothetical protein
MKYSGFQAQVVRPLVPMPYAPRPDPTRMYSSQPGPAITCNSSVGCVIAQPNIVSEVDGGQ